MGSIFGPVFGRRKYYKLLGQKPNFAGKTKQNAEETERTNEQTKEKTATQNISYKERC